LFDIGVEFLALIDNNHGAVQPSRELNLVVQVRVINKGAGARRRKSGAEGLARRDGRRQIATSHSPTDYAIVITL
jgi:hypothetical protein